MWCFQGLKSCLKVLEIIIMESLEIRVWKSLEFWNSKCVGTLYTVYKYRSKVLEKLENCLTLTLEKL